MKLYERLGLPAHWVDVDEAVQRIQDTEIGFVNPSSDSYRAYTKCACVTDSGWTAYVYHMNDDTDAAVKYARRCITHAREFFLGRWRNEFITPSGKPDPAYWLDDSWMYAYQQCLLWGAVLGDWRFLEDIAFYPAAATYLNDGFTSQDQHVFITIAALVKGEPHDKCLSAVERAAAGSNKCHKLLCEVMVALLDANVDRVNKTLATYLAHYKKVEFKKAKRLVDRSSVGGTVLVHLARHRGMAVEIPPEFADYIVAFKQ